MCKVTTFEKPELRRRPRGQSTPARLAVPRTLPRDGDRSAARLDDGGHARRGGRLRRSRHCLRWPRCSTVRSISRAEGDGSIAAARPRSHVAWLAACRGCGGAFHASPSLVSLVLSNVLTSCAAPQVDSTAVARFRQRRARPISPMSTARVSLCLRSPIANVLRCQSLLSWLLHASRQSVPEILGVLTSEPLQSCKGAVQAPAFC